jgi:uncharacterized iron-regulated protein
MRNLLRLISTVIAPALLTAACASGLPACATSGSWIAPDTLRPVANPIATASGHPVTLLGEEHDRAEDHRWELDTIERLYAHNTGMVLGFEMFPRAAQPALDRWVAGGVSEADFLQQTDWRHVWGFDPALYLPIFRFARDHHIPMLALNVSSHTIHLVSTHGFTGVSLADREGVGVPAAPAPGYRAELADVMGGHAGMAMTPDQLNHFIDAQQTWDRAMAEAIATQRAKAPSRPVVAIMGAGHLQNRYGIPHQLDALGLPGALVLLPEHDVSGAFGHGYADAVYIEPAAKCAGRQPLL